WKDVRLQTPEDLASVVGGTSVLPVVVPFARDRFEGIASGNLGSPFTLTLHLGRIDAGGKTSLGIVARRACLHKSDGWIDAERKRALFAMPSIRKAPVLSPICI